MSRKAFGISNLQKSINSGRFFQDVPSYFRHNYGVRLGSRDRRKIAEASNHKLYNSAVSILRLFNSRGDNFNSEQLLPWQSNGQIHIPVPLPGERHQFCLQPG